MKILMVLTSHADFGTSGKPTGYWLEELAAPYYHFLEKGAEITLASPKGGRPPLDPASQADHFQNEATRRFEADETAQNLVSNTLKLDEVKASDFDAVFYPGGHGPLYDLAEDTYSLALLSEFHSVGKPIGAVCHGVAALIQARTAIGEPILAGVEVTGFTDSEEAAVEATDIVPFSVEQEMKNVGAIYKNADDWADFSIRDGQIVTGQNPASSLSSAKLLAELLD